MPANKPAAHAGPAVSKEEIFRAFYAKAIRAAELAKRAGPGKWPYYRPHPSPGGPSGSSR